MSRIMYPCGKPGDNLPLGICHVLAAHPNNSEIQVCGLTIVNFLEAEMDWIRDHARAKDQTALIGIVTAAIKHHSSNERLLRCGCSLLSALGNSPEICRRFRNVVPSERPSSS